MTTLTLLIGALLGFVLSYYFFRNYLVNFGQRTLRQKGGNLLGNPPTDIDAYHENLGAFIANTNNPYDFGRQEKFLGQHVLGPPVASGMLERKQLESLGFYGVYLAPELTPVVDPMTKVIDDQFMFEDKLEEKAFKSRVGSYLERWEGFDEDAIELLIEAEKELNEGQLQHVISECHKHGRYSSAEVSKEIIYVKDLPELDQKLFEMGIYGDRYFQWQDIMTVYPELINQSLNDEKS